MATKLDSAIELIARGFNVFPLIENTKRPATNNGCNDATNDLNKIKEWWKNPSRNIGIGCQNIYVIDVDVKNGNGLQELNDMESELGSLPRTAVVKTPSGGLHLYFKRPDGDYLGQTGIKWHECKTHIDIRVGSQYVVAPPSTIAEGSYNWLNEVLHVNELEELPQSWLDFLPKKQVYTPVPRVVTVSTSGTSMDAYRLRRYFEKVGYAVQGQNGQGTMFSAINMIFNGFALSKEDGWPILMEYNSHCTPPWDLNDPEDNKWLNYAVDKAIATPRSVGEVKNAKRQVTQVIEYNQEFSDFEPDEVKETANETVVLTCDNPYKNTLFSNDGNDEFVIETTPEVIALEQAETAKFNDTFGKIFDNAKTEEEDISGTLPLDMMVIPGFINHCLNIMKKRATVFNHHCCFSGALMLLSTLIGPKFCCHGIYANLYLVALGISGCGKEFPRKFNEQVLKNAFNGSTSKLPFREFTSGEAIEEDIIANRIRLYQIDECDILFTTLSQGKEQFQRSMQKNLLEIYTKPSGYYTKRVNASLVKMKDEGRMVYNPYLNLFGTAPPKSYYESLSKRVTEGGLLGRLLIIKARRGVYNRENDDIIEDSDLNKIVEYAKWLNDFNFDLKSATSHGVDLQGHTCKVIPLKIKTTKEADAILNDFISKTKAMTTQPDIDEAKRSVFNRAVEKVYKLVLLYEMSRKWEQLMSIRDNKGVINPEDVENTLEVDEVAATWAVTFTKRLIATILEDLDNNFYINQHDKNAKEVYNVITKLCKRSKLEIPIAKETAIFSKLTSFSSKQVQELIDDLVNQEKITFVSIRDSRGHVRNGYTYEVQKVREMETATINA